VGFGAALSKKRKESHGPPPERVGRDHGEEKKADKDAAEGLHHYQFTQSAIQSSWREPEQKEKKDGVWKGTGPRKTRCDLRNKTGGTVIESTDQMQELNPEKNAVGSPTDPLSSRGDAPERSKGQGSKEIIVPQDMPRVKRPPPLKRDRGE